LTRGHRNGSEQARRHRYGGWLLLGLLILGGAGLAVWIGDPARLLALGDAIAGGPWATAALVVLMALMLTFALPGTLVLWLIAPFHPPLVSIALLLLGSVSGALGAYWFSGRVGDSPRMAHSRSRRLVKLLQRRGGLATQLALRVLPGFPHSMVNYAGGILRLPLRTFLLAAVLGLAVKWGVYATAVHEAADAVAAGEALHPQTLLPLFVLAALLLLGVVLQRWLARRWQLQ